MRLFRRAVRPGGSARERAEAIAAFWQWWAHSREDVARGIDAGTADGLEDLLGPRVARIHPDLDWETTPGRTARHALVVSAGGRPELRSIAERWQRAGPPADALWEYHPARRPDAGGFSQTVTMAGRTLAPAEAVVGARVDDRRCRVDVGVFHPSFPDLPDEARVQLAFLVLDWALGEDDVERWIGEVTADGVPPLDPVPVTGLGSLVHQLRDRWGPAGWASLEGTGPKGARVVARVRHPLLRVDHPLFDEHLVVALPYRDTDADGLPTETARAQLRAFEEHLTSRLGTSAVLVAHETSDGVRLLHLYDDGERSVLAQVQPLVAAWGGGRALITAEPDPAWGATEHLRP